MEVAKSGEVAAEQTRESARIYVLIDTGDKLSVGTLYSHKSLN